MNLADLIRRFHIQVTVVRGLGDFQRLADVVDVDGSVREKLLRCPHLRLLRFNSWPSTLTTTRCATARPALVRALLNQSTFELGER